MYSVAGHQPKLRCRKYCSHTGNSKMRSVIDDTAVKGRISIIPAAHQEKALKQLHLNHMGIEKTRLLA